MAFCSFLLISGIFILMTLLQTGTSDTLITQLDNDTNEYSPAQFRCSTSVSWTPDTIRWTLYNRNDTVHTYIVVQTSNCFTFSDKVSFEYNYTCVNRTVYTFTILNTTQEFHYLKIRCEFKAVNLSNTSPNITIKVSVPVKSVRMEPASNEIDSAENTSIRVYCNTSFSYPSPTVSWVLKGGTSRAIIEDSLIKTTSTSVDNFISSKSELTFLPNRTLNKWYLVCEASNVKGGKAVTKQVQLNITYPPDNPPTINGYSNTGTYRVILSRPGQLSCMIQGGNPLPSLTWDCFNQQVLSNYSGNDIVVINITWTAKHGQTFCTCRSQYMSNVTQTQINIDILFPPSVPTLKWNSPIVSGEVKVIENNTLTVVCESSSNPPAEYEWFGTSITPVTRNKLEIKNIQRSQTGNYTCLTRNEMNPSNGQMEYGTNSSSVSLDVLYPPERGSFSYVKNQDNQMITGYSINVIKLDNFSVSCNFIANPLASYVWNDGTKGMNRTFTHIVNDVNATCNATNKMQESKGSYINGTGTSTLMISVLYPPEIVLITFTSFNGTILNETEHLYVLENTSFTLTCSSNGRPKPCYKWFVNKTHNVNPSFTKRRIKRFEGGTYTCQAFNTMNRTFGDSTSGAHNTSSVIDVLYPAEFKHKLSNRSVAEGTNIAITCPAVIAGNPSTTFFRWLSEVSKTTANDTKLQLTNVSRHDSGVYTCTIYNEMKPSDGNMTIYSRNASFHLNVFFHAKVTRLSANTNESSTVVINENEALNIECSVEGNPLADISIIPTTSNENIKTVYSSSYISYKVSNSSYINAGIYACTAKNNITQGEPSRNEITVYVKGVPIPSSFPEFVSEVRSALHSSATLSFKAMSYPESTCSWQILNKTSWLNISENLQYVVATSNLSSSNTLHELQCNLTITNLTKSTGEEFKLRVINVVGEYVQNFTLKPHGKPEDPAEFTIIEHLRTTSAITLSWKPGFDGGLPQTFILQYKTLEGSYWNNIELNDYKGSSVVEHKIDGLASGTTYMFNLHSLNDKGKSSTLTLRVETKDIAKQSDEVSVSGIIGGITGVIVICVGIGIVLFLYRTRYVPKKAEEDDREPAIYQNMAFTGIRVRKQKNKVGKCNTGHLQKMNRKVPESIEKVINDMEEVDDIRHSQREPDNVEYLNSLDVIADLHRIKISELLWYVRDKTEDSFASEYQKLPQGLQKPCTIARKPENIALNRYNGIYPYDHSRVTVNGDPGFFINACYISGYKEDKAYIASLGPTTKTMDDFKTFWKMVWHEKSDIIVMLTNLNEPSGMKCEQYWPQFDMDISYGDIRVKSDDEEVLSEYVVRSFTLFHGNGRRKVTQLHYTAWPDKKVPEDVSTILEFRQRLKATPSSGNGPIIMHCSAGIGRTGTLIAIDRLIDQGRSEFSVNVFECVNSIREQRVKMVQTLDQYIYIHKALVNSLYFDSETVPIDHFHEFLEHINNNVYSKQFQQLKESVEISSQEQEFSVLRNEQFVFRNRERSDVPDDRHRVRLYYNIQMDRPDYINATYINSFKVKDQFIVAQTPLPCTIVDFIRIMYQENCCCVVVMEDLEEPGMPIGHYLPSDDHELQIKNFILTSAILESNKQYTVRKLKIVSTAKNLEGERSMYHFHFKNWIQGNDKPSDVQQFVQFVKEVNDYSEQLAEGLGRVLVHCLKANERSALYCIVAILMEKMRNERHVNVLNTIRRVRSRRRSALISMEQLKFCYQAVGAYINMLESEESC